jgi:FkbM family methyltransferase
MWVENLQVLSLLRRKLLGPVVARVDRLLEAQQSMLGRLTQLEQLVEGRLTQLEQLVEGRLQDLERLALERRAHGLKMDQQLAALAARMATEARDPGERYRDGLHAVGVLNYENYTVSGERRFLTRLLQQFPTCAVLDVGANTGQYSELVRELAPQAIIHAFEPHPIAFATLAQLAARIGATARSLALGAARGEVELFDYADMPGSQHASLFREVIEHVHRRPSASWKVPCETLDAVVAEIGLTRIGLLKVDTEGNELSVLQGGRQLITSGSIDVIQFEFNEMNVISRVFMKDFFTLLENYRIYRLLPEGVLEFVVYDPTFMEVFAFQNIVAIRRELDPSWIH